MSFPKRIYTGEEVTKARELIAKGYKHRLRVFGNLSFRRNVKRALELVKLAGYYDFLRTYIRAIKEIDGLTQLRQSEATIWANRYAVDAPVDASSVFVQKANSMKEYVEGKLYYGGAAEKRSDEKRIEYLDTLRKKTKDNDVSEECERLLKLWRDSSLVY